MKYLVLTRETTKEPWRNDSGYEIKSQAHGRVRLLRRFGDMYAKVEEVPTLPEGIACYDNCLTLRKLQRIRSQHAWGDEATYTEAHEGT